MNVVKYRQVMVEGIRIEELFEWAIWRDRGGRVGIRGRLGLVKNHRPGAGEKMVEGEILLSEEQMSLSDRPRAIRRREEGVELGGNPKEWTAEA